MNRHALKADRERQNQNILFPANEINKATMLANAVFSASKGTWDTTVNDPYLRCALMGHPVFTERKCWLYMSSGSKTCWLCSKRPELRTVQQFKKEEVMPSPRGICSECKKEKALVAKGKCYSCNGYDKPKPKKVKDPYSVEVKRKPEFEKFAPGVELPPPKVTVKPEVLEERRKVIAERAERPHLKTELEKMETTLDEFKDMVKGLNPQPPVPMAGKLQGSNLYPHAGPTVTFKTDVDNALFNKIAERARRNRREVGDEMLVLAEVALDYGNLGKDGGTITKVCEMIERMKSYPMPHAASSQEVYQLTLQIIQARVEELAA